MAEAASVSAVARDLTCVVVVFWCKGGGLKEMSVFVRVCVCVRGCVDSHQGKHVCLVEVQPAPADSGAAVA